MTKKKTAIIGIKGKNYKLTEVVPIIETSKIRWSQIIPESINEQKEGIEAYLKNNNLPGLNDSK